LNGAIQKSLASQAMAQTLSAASMSPPTVALPQLKGFIADEVSKWSQRYKDAGIEPK
jgi:tripartite-type tricarboxylate transporter receptor subunit TctC